MDIFYNFSAQTFGPIVQAVFFLFILLSVALCICAIAFWSEKRLILAKNRIMWIVPFPIFVGAFLYGGLRFTGQLLFPTDGWDQWGFWNYTNQNRGVCVLFLCGCLLFGVVLAMYKEKHYLKIRQ